VTAKVKAFTITSLPFVVAEWATGILSSLTGVLSIPPAVGLGTSIDLVILGAGLASAIHRRMKTNPHESPEGKSPESKTDKIVVDKSVKDSQGTPARSSGNSR